MRTIYLLMAARSTYQTEKMPIMAFEAAEQAEYLKSKFEKVAPSAIIEVVEVDMEPARPVNLLQPYLSPSGPVISKAELP